MHIVDRIDGLEKAIVEYYIGIGERRKGWTVLQNIKSDVDYTHGDDDWNVVYMKKLSNKIEELKIKNPIKQ